MYVKCLVENTSETDLKPKHGLCFYVETKMHKVLFDLGPDDLFAENAKRANIDLTKVDTVVISHGHKDHGGGLEAFLKLNNKAKIYLQKTAFEYHYVKFLGMKFNAGLNRRLMSNPQIILIGGDYKIDEELSLFVADKNELPSPMNKAILGMDKKEDRFEHEHSLLIKENKNVLFTGCSHHGVFNIIDKINDRIDFQIGGFHLFNPLSKKTASEAYLEEFKNKMKDYNNVFYTCHCTGKEAFDYLSKDNDKVRYFSCGMEKVF